jgi:acyl CoA:acetate/3-ketoacid CoA transferase
MNAAAAAQPIVKIVQFEGEEWLYFPAIAPDVAIIRATTADERGNLTFEQEGAYLGALDLAMAAHNTGGKVIAQVKRIAKAGTLKTHDVRVPGILIDYVVEAPDQWQTTQTPYDPAISGEIFRPMESFALMEWGIGKPIARRVAQELKKDWAVNLGFGVSANVPRIFIEEGLHGEATWVIEQGAVGGVPLLDFQFGCSSNAEAIVPSPHQFTYFQASGFDCALLSFLQIDSHGSVNVSKLGVRPHVTAGAGGFVDITSRARKIVYSGFFNAGAKMRIAAGKLAIDQEGKVKKLVREVEQVSFSGRRGVAQGQDVTYVTERCVMKLAPEGIVVTEIAPGVDLQQHVLAQSEFPLIVSPNLKTMEAALFKPEPFGLKLDG